MVARLHPVWPFSDIGVAFEGVDPALLRRTRTNFDGEGTDSRLDRRQRNWIGSVTFAGTS